MPLGSKKRKAMKKKKKKKEEEEEELGATHGVDSDSPANFTHVGPSANGAAHHDNDLVVQEEGEEERDNGSDHRHADEEFELREADLSDRDVAAAYYLKMASLENGGDEDIQNPSEELLVSEAQELNGESEKTGEAVEDEPPPLPHEAPAATAVELEESVNEDEVVVAQAIESTVTESESVVLTDPAIETKFREIGGISQVVSTPSAADRATFWNCCGLLDLFSGSQR